MKIKKTNIKFIDQLKTNYFLMLSIFLIFFTYILGILNDKYIILFILSLLYFSYNLINIYEEKTIQRIKLYILIFIDITYTMLYHFNLKYILAYILISFILFHYEDRKIVFNKRIGVMVELISIYTIFKIFTIILMLLV